MDKIKKIEKKVLSEILNSKDELINLGVELEDLHFEFEPRYIKLLEDLENSQKIFLDRYPVEFVLLLPSLLGGRKYISLRFLPVWREFIVTASIDSAEDLEEARPYLYLFIPTFSSLSEKDIRSYLPDDLFSLEDGYIALKFKPLVKYREFII
jgi:hypothetical protein